MVIGVGVDLVSVARVEAALERTPALAARLFTDAERELPVRSLAARFAAKEAAAKALGSPPGLRWIDLEIGRATTGQPHLRPGGTVAETAVRLGVRRWHVSLSHDGGMAMAMVVAES